MVGGTRISDGALTLPSPASGRGFSSAGRQWPPSSQPPRRMDGGDAAGEVAVFRPLEPGGLDALHQLVLRREAADALDEILVGVAIAGDQRADPRQDAERIEIIETR